MGRWSNSVPVLSLQQKGFCLWVYVSSSLPNCFEVPACVAKAAVLRVQLFYNGKQLNKEVKVNSAVALEHWGTARIQGSGMLFQASVPCSPYYFSPYIYLYHIHFFIYNFTSNSDKIVSIHTSALRSSTATRVQNCSCFPQ